MATPIVRVTIVTVDPIALVKIADNKGAKFFCAQEGCLKSNVSLRQAQADSLIVILSLPKY